MGAKTNPQNKKNSSVATRWTSEIISVAALKLNVNTSNSQSVKLLLLTFPVKLTGRVSKSPKDTHALPPPTYALCVSWLILVTTEVTHCCSEEQESTETHTQSVWPLSHWFSISPIKTTNTSSTKQLLHTGTVEETRVGEGGGFQIYFSQLKPLLCGSLPTEYDWSVSHLLLMQVRETERRGAT